MSLPKKSKQIFFLKIVALPKGWEKDENLISFVVMRVNLTMTRTSHSFRLKIKDFFFYHVFFKLTYVIMQLIYNVNVYLLHIKLNL